jgi:hypothetical protein
MTQFVKLRGRVVDDEGKPASNVDVKVGVFLGYAYSDAMKVSDKGEFTIEKIEPGSYTLLASPSGCAQLQVSTKGPRWSPRIFPPRATA